MGNDKDPRLDTDPCGSWLFHCFLSYLFYSQSQGLQNKGFVFKVTFCADFFASDNVFNFKLNLSSVT